MFHYNNSLSAIIVSIVLSLTLLGCATSQAPKKTPQQYIQEAKAGDSLAQDALGIFYFNGIQGFPKDEKKAQYWFMQGAKNGLDRSQFNVGVNYLNGYGVAKDQKKALYWFEKAAAQGHQRAKIETQKLKRRTVSGETSEPTQKTGIFAKDSPIFQAYTNVVTGQKAITKCPQLLSAPARKAYSVSGQRTSAYLATMVSIAEETENVEPYFTPALRRSYATYQVLKDQHCTAKDIKNAIANGQEGLKLLKNVAYVMSEIKL